jgi:hypothetical protein
MDGSSRRQKNSESLVAQSSPENPRLLGHDAGLPHLVVRLRCAFSAFLVL